MDSPKLMFFWKKSEGGGEIISDPKKIVADFFVLETIYFGPIFWGKCPKRGEGVISNPKNFIADFLYSKRYMTTSQINPSYECGKWMKVKVAKWC